MGNPAGRRVSRDTARDGRSRRAHVARPVVRACRATARHRGVGAKAFWLLCRFCKVTRRKAGTLSGRCRSNGYVQKTRATLTLALSRRRGNRLGGVEDNRWPVCYATARRRRRGGHSYRLLVHTTPVAVDEPCEATSGCAAVVKPCASMLRLHAKIKRSRGKLAPTGGLPFSKRQKSGRQRKSVAAFAPLPLSIPPQPLETRPCANWHGVCCVHVM